MKVRYLIHHSVQPFVGDAADETEFELNNRENEFEFRAQSAFSDMKYCFLEVYLPETIKNFGNFDLSCKKDQECVVVYKGTQKNF